MEITKGDYIIARTESSKTPFALKIKSASPGSLVGVIAKDQHVPGKKEVLELKPTEVILNLGMDPRPGKVYGVDVTNLYRFRVEHDKFGTLYYMYRPTKEIMDSLSRAFNIAYKKLKSNGLEHLAGEDQVLWEVVSYNKEKYSGMYFHRPKETEFCRYHIRPEALTASDYPYVILHEIAHRLHLQYARGSKLNAAWIKLFNTSIKLESITKETARDLRDLLLSGNIPPSKLLKELDEEQQLAYRWVLRYINASHAISAKELDILFKADERDEIKSLWPIRTITKKELEPVISEYACTNVRETIAEAVSFYLIGKKLPKTVVKLVERTIEQARGNFVKGK